MIVLGRLVTALILSGLLLAGCLRVETNIRVQADGSGTITESVLLSRELVEMATQMTEGEEAFDTLDEPKLRSAAANYGTGVTLQSAERLETEFGQGYVVRYGFRDVSALQLDTDAGKKLPDEIGEEAPPDADQDETKPPELITFAFEGTADGTGPAELVVRWPIDESDASDPGRPAETAPPEDLDPAILDMMKGFLEGMRMTFTLDVGGTIIETNATHRDGPTVTLMDIDFDDLLSNREALMVMAQQESQSLSEMKPLLKAVPGLKLEVAPEVRVRFRPAP